MTKFNAVKRLLWLTMSFIASTSLAFAATNHNATLGSFGKTTVSSSEITSLISSLNQPTQNILTHNKPALENLVRKELVRKHILSIATKKRLKSQKDVSIMANAAYNSTLFLAYLNSRSTPPSNYPSTDDIQSAYKNNLSKFIVPARVHLAQIFKVVDSKHTLTQQRKKIDLLYKHITTGKITFSAAEKKASDQHQNAKNGGDLGWLSVNYLPPEFINALKTMSLKQPLNIVTNKDGVHLIKLIDQQPQTFKPLADVKNIPVASLRQSRQQELQQDYLNAQLKRNPITFQRIKVLEKYLNNKDKRISRSKRRLTIAKMGRTHLTLGEIMDATYLFKNVPNTLQLFADDAWIKERLIKPLLLQKNTLNSRKARTWTKRKDNQVIAQRARDDVYIQAVLNKLFTLPKGFPSAKQVTAAYNQNKQKFHYAESVHLAQIFIAHAKDVKQDEKIGKGVQDLYKLLLAKPEKFEELAKRYSQDVSSKNNGGDKGWVSLSTLQPVFLKSIKKMHKNSMSSIIETKDGWHILKYIDYRPAGFLTLKEVSPTLTQSLRKVKLQAVQNKGIQQMLADKKIKLQLTKINALIMH